MICGDGGVQLSYRRILRLPQHGGAACPAAASLLTSSPCPRAQADALPACPSDDQCDVPLPLCGSSPASCGFCQRGRHCSATADCAPGLACRTRKRETATRLFCLRPIPSAAPPVFEELLPDLTSAAASGQGALPVRQPREGELAGGIVVQLPLSFGTSAVLSVPGALDSVRDTLLQLFGGFAMPQGVSIDVDFRVSSEGAARLLLRARADLRRLESGSTAVTAVVGVDLRNVSNPASALVSESSTLARRLTDDLILASGTVGTAIALGLASVAPAAASAGVQLQGEPVFAVLSQSGDAVVDASTTVLASSSPSPTASPSPAGLEAATIVYIVVGSALGIASIAFAGRYLSRTCSPRRGGDARGPTSRLRVSPAS